MNFNIEMKYNNNASQPNTRQSPYGTNNLGTVQRNFWITGCTFHHYFYTNECSTEISKIFRNDSETVQKRFTETLNIFYVLVTWPLVVTPVGENSNFILPQKIRHFDEFYDVNRTHIIYDFFKFFYDFVKRELTYGTLSRAAKSPHFWIPLIFNRNNLFM